MPDETYISHAAAKRILCQQGDFTENQAEIVLGHSLKSNIMGGNYYPMAYIYNRAKTNAVAEDDQQTNGEN